MTGWSKLDAKQLKLKKISSNISIRSSYVKQTLLWDWYRICITIDTILYWWWSWIARMLAKIVFNSNVHFIVIMHTYEYCDYMELRAQFFGLWLTNVGHCILLSFPRRRYWYCSGTLVLELIRMNKTRTTYLDSSPHQVSHSNMLTFYFNIEIST